jgi:predicted metalloenzyme YecM
MIELVDFSTEAKIFLDQMASELEQNGMAELIPKIDHFCLRVKTLERYGLWKNHLSLRGVLLAETPVNGRPIATYKLFSPIQIHSIAGDQVSVGVVEVPAPKQNADYPEGFEHIEIVVTSLIDFEKKWPLKYTGSEAINNITHSSQKELKLQLNGGLVKFHEKSLEDIIIEENKAMLR